MKLKNYFLLAALIAFGNVLAQETTGPTNTGMVTNYVYVPSIAEQIANGTIEYADNITPRVAPEKRRVNLGKLAPGKGLPSEGFDAAMEDKDAIRYPGRAPIFTFEADTSTPFGVTDPTGAVGPDHYLAAWNTNFRIFDKAGNPLTAELSLGTVLTGNTLGDPIMLYDKFADRYVITQFDNAPNGFEVAISAGPNPVTDGWHVYLNQFTTGSFPDYTKFSIWPDGYYVTANVGTNAVYVVEREQMLLGLPAQFVELPLNGIATAGFYSPQIFNVGQGDLPAPGNATVVFLQDDAFAGITNDHLKLWDIDVNWAAPGSSTISAVPIELGLADGVSPFTAVFDGGSFSNIPSLGSPDQDALQQTIMNQAQFRKFPTHNSAIFNFVVDTDASAAELAGIRWYELRQATDGAPWEVYQEGTYTSNAPGVTGRHAFSGSMGMDDQGNIAMAYTTTKGDERIGIRYTGRFASDPLGMMTIEEQTIAMSTGSNTTNRLADYVHLTLDPSDDQTFWHIAEYFNTNKRDVVGVFKIAPDTDNDVGVVAINQPNDGTLSATETVEVTVRNFGTVAQTNIPISFSVDGGPDVNEIVPGPIASASNVTYTFTATAAMGTVGTTYSITATTSLVGDENTANDAFTKDVTYLEPDDVGVTAISSPTTGVGLGATETVTVTVENFGGDPQTNVPVFYNIDGGANVDDVVPGPVPVGGSVSFDFATTADVSVLGSYDFIAGTELGGDSDTSNDDIAVTVENQFCQPSMDCSFGDGLQLVQVGTIDNPSGCEGYADFTAQVTELLISASTDITFTTGYGDQFVRVWIDFNDNNAFELTELVLNNVEIADGAAGGSYTETFSLTVPSGVTLGEHIMRIKTNWNAPVPNDACEETDFGETEDYTADIVTVLGVDDVALSDSDFTITSTDNKNFQITLSNTSFDDLLQIRVNNILGQTVLANWIENTNGSYTFDLDMSYASSGVYLVRLGTGKFGRVKRIIVR